MAAQQQIAKPRRSMLERVDEASIRISGTAKRSITGLPGLVCVQIVFADRDKGVQRAHDRARERWSASRRFIARPRPLSANVDMVRRPRRS